MQNTSEQFKIAISEPHRKIRSRIAFPGLILDENQIQIINADNSLVFGADFEVGTAPMSKTKIEIIVDTKGAIAPEIILNYDYEGKECDAEIGIELSDGDAEYVSIGQYTVKTANKKNNKLTLDCIDRMYKAEKDYESNLLYPATLLEILQSACEQAGLELATINFANADYLVANEPVYDFVNCRKIFAQVAELAGGYAVINRQGKLEIITLGIEPVREITKDNYINFKHNEVAVGQIDRVIVKIGEVAAEAGEGPNIYTVVDNMFVQDPTDVVDSLYNILKNVNYTACEFNWQGDPSLDLGDKVSINGLETYLLDRNMIYNGGLREDYSSPAKSNVEKESTGKGSMTIDINQIKTQIRVMEGEITQTIEKVENLVVDAANRLYQSQTEIPFDLNVGTGSVQLLRDSHIPYYKVTSDTNIDISASFPNSQYAEDLTGEQVTISLDVLVDVDRIVNIDGREFNVKGNRWTRIYVTKEFAENSTKNVRIRNPFSRKLSRDKINRVNLIENLTTDINTIYYRNLQVQKGNVPSNWTLTPEELEGNIKRAATQIKQLADSISLMVTKNEFSSEILQHAESVVTAINSTDGVGRLKTTKVTVDGNGLAVDDGALIIRDSNNTAIITSDGLKMKYVYSSSGPLLGWTKMGIAEGPGGYFPMECLLLAYIPDELKITRAYLHVESMPSHLTNDPNGNPNGTYHPRSMRINKVIDTSDGLIWVDGYGIADQPTYNGRVDITSSTWGSNWSPAGLKIATKSTDIANHLDIGRNVFILDTTVTPNLANRRYFGLVKMELEVEGYLRG